MDAELKEKQTQQYTHTIKRGRAHAFELLKDDENKKLIDNILLFHTTVMDVLLNYALISQDEKKRIEGIEEYYQICKEGALDTMRELQALLHKTKH